MSLIIYIRQHTPYLVMERQRTPGKRPNIRIGYARDNYPLTFLQPTDTKFLQGLGPDAMAHESAAHLVLSRGPMIRSLEATYYIFTEDLVKTMLNALAWNPMQRAQFEEHHKQKAIRVGSKSTPLSDLPCIRMAADDMVIYFPVPPDGPEIRPSKTAITVCW